MERLSDLLNVTLLVSNRASNRCLFANLKLSVLSTTTH